MYYIIKIPNKNKSKYRVYKLLCNQLSHVCFIVPGGGPDPVIKEYKTEQQLKHEYAKLVRIASSNEYIEFSQREKLKLHFNLLMV